jgi:O-antigen/teichoic acid export membrane protein
MPAAAPAVDGAAVAHHETRLALRNGLKLTLSLFSTLAVAFAVRFWLPRALGPQIYGQVHFSEYFSTVWMILTALGVDTYISRETAVRPAHVSEFFGGLLVVRLGVSVLVWVGMLVALAGMNKPWVEFELVTVFTVGQVLFHYNGSLGAMLQAVGHVSELAYANVSTKLAWGVGVVVGILAGGGVRVVALSFLLGEAMKASVLQKAAAKHVGLRLHVQWQALRAVLITCVPYFIHSVALRTYSTIDVTMISWLASDQEVGWYGAATNVTYVAFLVMPVLQAVLLPMGVRIGEASHEALANTMRGAARLALVFTAPAGLLLSLGAEPVIQLLYKGRFQQSVPSLQILGLFVPLTALMTISALQIIQQGRMWTLTKISLTGLVLNPALNLFAIPAGLRHFGEGGAGLAAASTTVLTEIVVAGLTFGALGRDGFDRKSAILITKTGIAGGLVALVHFLTPSLGVWKIVLDGVLYLAIAAPLGAFPVVEMVTAAARKIRSRQRGTEAAGGG